MFRERLIMIFTSFLIRQCSSMRLSVKKYEILAYGARSTFVKEGFMVPLKYSSRSKRGRGRGASLCMWGEGPSNESPFDDEAEGKGTSRKDSLRTPIVKTTTDDEGRKLRIKRDKIDGFRSRGDMNLNPWDEDGDSIEASRGKTQDKTNVGIGGWDDFDDNEKKFRGNKAKSRMGGWDDSYDYDDDNIASRSRNTDRTFDSDENYRRTSNSARGWDDLNMDEKKPRGSTFSKRTRAEGWDNTEEDDGGNGSSRLRKFNPGPFQSSGRVNRRDKKPDSFNRQRLQNPTFSNQRGVYEGNSISRSRSIKPDMQDFKDNREGKINMRVLDLAGYVHLYGLAPILNALSSGSRSFEVIQTTLPDMDPKSDDISPEARLAPCLFIQDRVVDGRSGDKAAAAREIEVLAKQRGLPIAYVDKGVLNTLCENRPHQGYVLRCGKLNFEIMNRIPKPSEDESVPKLWLVLDEVVDPQNFGALLRSAYFLGGSQNNQGSIGVLICEKNSAPPSPVVSAASAGALELIRVYSTTNLPRTLNAAKDDGWRIVGAAVSTPSGMIDENTGELPICYDLFNLASARDNPTLLVLGSEGQGLRKLVARGCTEFVRIPGMIPDVENDVDDDFTPSSRVGVDSLNVSVSGGIILWHLLHGIV